MSKIPKINFDAYGLHITNPASTSKKKLAALGSKIKDVFSSVGFCYLKNHGVDEKLIDDYMKVSRDFFESSVEAKQKCRAGTEIEFGWSGIDGTNVHPTSPADLKESFLYLPTQDLPAWPIDNFKHLNKKMHEECTELTYRFLDVLSYGLNLPTEILRNVHGLIGRKGNTTTIRSLYYPPVSSYSNILPGQTRCKEHTDFGTITFLFQDKVGGLEIQHPDGGYIQATPIAGTIIVNIGSILQRLTSDSLVAALHRVVIPEDETRKKTYRQSIAFFVNPDDDYVVKCLDGSDKYQPIKTADYLIQRTKKVI